MTAPDQTAATGQPAATGQTAAPTCPHCNQPITRALDAPYGFWEWNGEAYELRTASKRVDVSPWVHWDCMGELRDFHPQDPVTAPAG